MQSRPAHDPNVVGAHAQHAVGGLAHRGEGLGQELVEGRPPVVAVLELARDLLELGVGELRVVVREGLDLVGDRVELRRPARRRTCPSGRRGSCGSRCGPGPGRPLVRCAAAGSRRLIPQMRGCGVPLFGDRGGRGGLRGGWRHGIPFRGGRRRVARRTAPRHPVPRLIEIGRASCRERV